MKAALVRVATFLLATASACPAQAEAAPVRQRLIVLSDIEADPDDSESFVRLLVYANAIDIEGMIATTSVHMQHEVHPDSMRRIVAQYGKVQPNLLLHEPGYPTAAALLSRIRSGQPDYGLAAVGAGKDTPGSAMIVAALEAADARPLWISVWGGANTLAQALFTIRATHNAGDAQRLVAKLRVYAISDQDDSGAWLRRTFPGLFYVVSPGGYGAATWMGMGMTGDGIDNEVVSNGWIARNIQQGHGPLGAAYPDVGYGMEGDTPSFLSLIPNGLSDSEHPDWGGWGGRYTLRVPALAETDPKGFNGGVPVEQETRPIWTNAVDTVTPYVPADYGRAIQPGPITSKDYRATLWRWRDAVQNDFAARIGWTTLPYAKANHPPVVALTHPDRLTVHSGAIFTLDAGSSRDPDGDSLSYLWFNYPEAGSWTSPIPALGAENIHRAVFRAPQVARPETAHFIVQVTDKGTPPLTRYKRVIVTILP
jgi:hypothetical protein